MISAVSSETKNWSIASRILSVLIEESSQEKHHSLLLSRDTLACPHHPNRHYPSVDQKNKPSVAVYASCIAKFE